MEQVELDGMTVQLSERTGTAISSQKRSETTIRSSGGGGYVQGGSGYVTAPTISSTVTTKHELWVRTDEGDEIPVQLSGVDIPVAEGQRLGLVSANAGRAGAQLVQIINYSARSSHPLWSNLRLVTAAHLYPSGVLKQRKLVIALVTLVVAGLLATISSEFMFIVLGAIVYMGYQVFRSIVRQQDVALRLGKRLESRLKF